VFGFCKEGGGGADLAGGAVAALESVVIEEGFLDGAEAGLVAKAFDGSNFRALSGDGEGETRVDTAAVEEDGTGAALAVIASFFAAGEIEVFAEEIEEGGAGIDGEGVELLVDGDAERHRIWRGSTRSFCECEVWQSRSQARRDDGRGGQKLATIEVKLGVGITRTRIDSGNDIFFFFSVGWTHRETSSGATQSSFGRTSATDEDGTA